MSFSSEVKNELLNTENNPCCKHAMNYGILLFGRAFSATEFSFLTENSAVAEAYCEAFRYFSDTEISPVVTAGGKYKVHIDDRDSIKKILEKTGLSDGQIKRRVNFANFPNPCCFSAFIRGAFLACGTVTNPEKEYHLEFSVSTKGLCEDIIKIFDEYDPSPKMTQRSGSYTVYFKNSTDIEDVLAIMGATENSLQFMGAKVFKDIRNTVNRKVNFENANLARTIAAAAKQYEAIALIKEKVGLDSLPEDLQEIAKLRYNDRELSNSEIAKMLSVSITVSGVNHRFKRIMKIAEELKK
ncbi:MAG: DNA-binding protein WhiA [Clostridia bacterium]|nr:DNA-binding protein WhiA [Clostridia bacterium]